MSAIRTPDFDHYSMDLLVTEASLKDDIVSVRWSDGYQTRFHALWLRDNDASDHSIAERSRERKYSLLVIPADIRPDTITVSAQGGLQIEWPDGVSSHYHPGWLREHDYSNPSPKSKNWTQTLWSRQLERNLPTFSATEVMQDPESHIEFLRAFREYGLAVLTHSPTAEEEFEGVASQIGMLRDMNWGKVFDIDSKLLDAYLSSTELPMEAHSDAPTREYMPGVQICQCVQNTVEGGESFWVDGFNVAAILKRDFPADYDVLTSVPWPHSSRNKSNDYRTAFPLFQCNSANEIEAIRDTPWLRDPFRGVFDDVPRVYEAYRRYVGLKDGRDMQVEHKLRPGDVVFVDNRRCLHGRRSINTSTGHRHFRTAYSERDEYLSTLRTLERDMVEKAALAM